MAAAEALTEATAEAEYCLVEYRRFKQFVEHQQELSANREYFGRREELLALQVRRSTRHLPPWNLLMYTATE